MLKKPFKKIHEIEMNNYYTLDTSDTTFLVVESVLPYKRLIRSKEFTTAIKMLPLNSHILYTFAKVLQLPKTGESGTRDGMENEEYFDILDVKSVRNELKHIVESSDAENHRFDYRKPVHNALLRELVNEGYDLLNTELIGTYMRKQWFLRTDKNGVVRVVEATLGGKPSTAKLVDIKFHTVNRNIIYKILENIKEKKI